MVDSKKDTRSRKWQITINNPQNLDQNIYTFSNLKTYINKSFDKILYFCYSFEIGLKEKTEHIHIFLYFENPVRFSTIQKYFTGFHIENCKGTCIDNKNYIFKIGKWEKSDKEDTRIEGMQFESGEVPEEKGQGQRTDLEQLYTLLESNLTNAEIYATNPNFMRYASNMDRMRQDIFNNIYNKKTRPVVVIYIYGTTGTGKSWNICNNHGYENVYRISDYTHPFDEYTKEKVVCYEEFRSCLPIKRMLQELDVYPYRLPCRYANRIALYDTIYIISNIPLEKQYENIQEEDNETWNAFLRRIDIVQEYCVDGSVKTYINDENQKLDNYFNNNPTPEVYKYGHILDLIELKRNLRLEKQKIIQELKDEEERLLKSYDYKENWIVNYMSDDEFDEVTKEGYDLNELLDNLPNDMNLEEYLNQLEKKKK